MLFAARVVPLHVLYYLYSMAAFVIGAARHFRRRDLQPRGGRHLRRRGGELRQAEPDLALRELSRVLRPGGELILTLDNGFLTGYFLTLRARKAEAR